MTTLLIIKSIIVIIFLVIFLRRPRVLWGIGLLTVTTAVLLDTFLGTFGREEMIAVLGFFFYIISGALFAGGAIWTWGILHPLTESAPVASNPAPVNAPPVMTGIEPRADHPSPDPEPSPPAFDRQMLFDEIRYRFGREDILDLIFDLGINENDVISFNQNMDQLIINVMDVAAQWGQTGALALAVERILTPLPPEHLPRLERINSDSPPTILRHYLLAHYNLTQLSQIAADLEIDWEQLGAGSKKDMVRNLLLHLYRRNRTSELIETMYDMSGQ